MATQKVIFELVVEDSGLTARIEQTRAVIRELNSEIRKNPGPERFNELAGELAKNRRALKELTEEQKELNRQMAATKVPKDSLAGLRLEYARLTKELAILSAAERKSDFGKSIIKNAAAVKKEIDGIEQSVGRFTGNVGNYQSALNGIGQAFAALGIGVGIGEILNINTKISDSIANVAKTSGLAIDKAQELSDALEFRNTRTSLADQLKIAEIGGQLGIAATELENFTASVDTLNVALGDQFGSVEEVTRVTAGLRNVLTDFRTDDTADDILRIGNALNFLEAKGVATAPTIAEFVNRISGAAIPLGVTTEQIFGLSTALAELNINPERGANAVNRVLQEVVKTPAAFAKAIGESEETFTKLVEQDLVGAVTLVAQKVTEGADSNVAFARTLDDLGIDSQGAIEVFGKLGGNLDLLKTRTEQSRDALQSTDSITKEFEVKNNNAAAAVEKLQNAIVNLIASEGAQDAIEATAKAVTNLVTALGEGIAFLSEYSTEFTALGAALLAFTGPGQSLAVLLTELNALTRVNTLGIVAQTEATVLQTIATRASTVATNILSAAQKALPLFALIAGIYAVVKAVESYNANLSAAEKATNAVADAQEEIAQSSAKEVVALNASISVLQDATASQKARAAAIKQLTSTYPEYLKGIDLETQSAAALTVIQRELTDEIVRGAAARAKATAQEKVSTEIVKQQLEVARLKKAPLNRVDTVVLGVGLATRNRQNDIKREEDGLKKLQDELVETGKKFDEVFKLGQPSKSSALTIVDPEAVKADVDKAVVVASNAAASITAVGKKEADKRADGQQKRADEESKSVEAQQKRIRDIQKSVRDIQLSDEQTFDADIARIENERLDVAEKTVERLVTLRERIKQETGQTVTGTTGADVVRQGPSASAASVTEADLIDQETAAALAALDGQVAELTSARKQAADKAQSELRARLAEVAQIVTDNEANTAEGVQRTIEISFEQRREQLTRSFEQRNTVLTESLSKGSINEREFTEQTVSNKIEETNRLLQLEQEYATRITEVVTQVRDVKVAAAKTALDAQLEGIETRRFDDVAQVEQDILDTPEISAAKVSAINEKAAADATAAQIDYANTVQQTTLDATATQLQAVDAVDAAKQGTHEAELARIEAEKEARRQVVDAAIGAASQIAGRILEIEQQNIDREAEAKTAAINEEYEAKKVAAKGNAKLIEKLEKEQVAKIEAVEKDQAKKRQQIAIIEAVINTASAIIKAAPNPILMALAAAVGAAQIAVISSQEFSQGGFPDEDNAARPTQSRQRRRGVYPKRMYDALPDFSGRGGFTGAGGATDQTGHRVAGKLSRSNAVVHGGEYVAPAYQVARHRELFEELDRQRGILSRPMAVGGFTDFSVPMFHLASFANGGFTEPFVGLPSSAQLQAQTVNVTARAEFTGEQTAQIGNIIAQEISAQIRPALADGLFDANRRLEREQSLEKQRTV